MNTERVGNTDVSIPAALSAAPSADAPPGVVLPPPPFPSVPGYEILSELGHGGMGVVYQARQVKLNRLVALKVVREDTTADPTELTRFLLEVEAVASIDHPSVVKVHDFGAYGDGEKLPYFAMEYLTGGSLAARLKGRSLPPKEAAALVEKVARGVQAVHDQGIVHRDLKPHNVLFDSTGEPKVTDFGVAKRGLSDLTQTGAVMGTPAYMAPEQAAGNTKFVGPTADVYALGVILYQCLTGTVPFTGGDTWEIISRVTGEQPPPPRGLNPMIDADLEAVCLKCLEKDPRDRYPSALALATDLDHHLHGEAVSARPPGFGDWLRQLWRTRPEPNAYAGPPVLLWFGAIMLTAHSTVFGLAAAGASVIGVWIALALCAGSAGVVAWWYLLRHFRRLIATERHSTVVAMAHILAQTGLLVLIPYSPDADASAALLYYPPLTALSGMGLFIIGSTHWGRFILFGLFVLSLVPVMHWFPSGAPLLYGVVMAAVMWHWAYSVGVTFARPRAHNDPCRSGAFIWEPTADSNPPAP